MARKKHRPHEKPTCKRLIYLIKDEKKSSVEYARYGFKELADDESSHKDYLIKIYIRNCKTPLKRLR